jgi:DNA-directed RNA polymerase subunit RPC12/RpoP
MTSAIGRIDCACPSCGVELSKRPTRKQNCQDCRAAIFVRHRPWDDKWVLLRSDELERFDAERAAYHAPKPRTPRPPGADDPRANPEYWREYNARCIKNLDEADRAGLRLEFRLLTSQDESCSVAELRADQVFGRGELQALPLPGCSLAPFCNCAYSPELPDEKPFTPPTPEEMARSDREFAATLASLPGPIRQQVLGMLNSARGGFGLPPWKPK